MFQINDKVHVMHNQKMRTGRVIRPTGPDCIRIRLIGLDVFLQRRPHEIGFVDESKMPKPEEQSKPETSNVKMLRLLGHGFAKRAQGTTVAKDKSLLHHVARVLLDVAHEIDKGGA